MDEQRERAINRLRYAGEGQIADANLGGLARQYAASPEEIARQEAEARKWRVIGNRREALAATMALGRRYDSALDAIADAKEVAAWIGLEID